MDNAFTPGIHESAAREYGNKIALQMDLITSSNKQLDCWAVGSDTSVALLVSAPLVKDYDGREIDTKLMLFAFHHNVTEMRTLTADGSLLVTLGARGSMLPRTLLFP